MSQKINHRRDGKRHQDNGPTWESSNPMAGCNSTHVARARAFWRTLKRRQERRGEKGHSPGRYQKSHRWGGGGTILPTINDYEDELIDMGL